ncbi:MAG TPA: ABC transporter ATP-binding protein [Thermodesulfobacteriota bacterium]|nr:ABC transporter ATP-binding protein [Thermodesulfobacteriota bacterium]
MILEVKDLNVYIKASHILRNVSLEVGEKEVVCLIGRNGAGKTTILRTIMGFLKPEGGSIKFKGEELRGRAPHEIALKGIGFAPEESEIFADLTTFENIEIATWTRETSRQVEERIKLAYSVFPALEKYKGRKGEQISGGERKMLSIARALALDPHMLLLDESFEGLSPAIIPQIAESIHEIAKMGRPIFLAESNIYHVPDFTDRLYVIERGEIIFSGKPEELIKDKAVLKIVAGAA